MDESLPSLPDADEPAAGGQAPGLLGLSGVARPPSAPTDSGSSSYKVIGPDGRPVTTGDIESAVTAIKENYPEIFTVDPASVNFVPNLRDEYGRATGSTDLLNNIKLNAEQCWNGGKPWSDAQVQGCIRMLAKQLIPVQRTMLDRLSTAADENVQIEKYADESAKAIAENIVRNTDFLKQRRLRNGAGR